VTPRALLPWLALAAGCNGPTTLLVTVEAAPGVQVSSAELQVMLQGADGSVATSLVTDGGASGTLGTVLVVLPQPAATTVDLEADGIDASGAPLRATVTATSQPHQQRAVAIVLGGPPPDGAAGDLAALQWIAETSNATEDLFAIWGSSESDIYAVGASGRILHFDGTAWASRNSGRGEALAAIWGSGANDVWVAGASGILLHATDGGMTWNVVPSGTTANLNGLWGFPNGPLYAVAANGVVVRAMTPGGTWSQSAKLTGIILNGVWGSSPSDLYVVGKGSPSGSHSTDGASWATALTTSFGLDAIYGWGASSVVTVGDRDIQWWKSGLGMFLSRGGSVPVNLHGLWGTSVTDFYIVGDQGTILRKTGSTGWDTQPEGAPSVTLYGVWGSGAGDVRAVGVMGTILRRPP
jgi:hypothetical protein